MVNTLHLTTDLGLGGRERIVVDLANDRVQKFDSSGNYILQWGGSGSGDGEFGGFPFDVIVDHSDYVYVSDPDNYRVQIFVAM